ncbi:antibiotic biosynthesis monooxygenase family protein [Labrenzia sp. DG1229]|uniref:antibiotic biosynthesis monooxygenase family protein n=1 Tax=Labrenzia sp. DG1229 TaxID=681847 RepID=UPI000691767A|nr:antibiotic biosynthesis monooxygenase family protein [Labrenzia sp. DG1229]
MPNFPDFKSFSLALLILAGFLAATAAIAADLKTNDPVTLINVFEVPADQIDTTVEFWEKSRDFLRQQPGYISTRLHRALAPDARFQLINVAIWESPRSLPGSHRQDARNQSGHGCPEHCFPCSSLSGYPDR